MTENISSHDNVRKFLLSHPHINSIFFEFHESEIPGVGLIRDCAQRGSIPCPHCSKLINMGFAQLGNKRISYQNMHIFAYHPAISSLTEEELELLINVASHKNLEENSEGNS